MLQSGSCFLTPRLRQPNYPLFIFLPGMDGTGQLLKTQTEGLEAYFDVRCLAIPPTDLTTWEGLSDQVVALVQQELNQTPDRGVYLCGESFGGCLAMKVVVRSPNLFQRVILINPALSLKHHPWMMLGAQLTRILPDPLYRLSTLGLLPWLSRLERISRDDRRALLQAMQSVPKSTSAWRLALLSQFEVSAAELQQLTQPFLLLGSQRDSLLPSLTELEWLRQNLHNARLVVLPYSGHTCLLESEMNLLEIIKEHHFLAAEGLPERNLNPNWIT
jgi:pimeloyl-ACP methyl ester carboxylesterase